MRWRRNLTSHVSAKMAIDRFPPPSNRRIFPRNPSRGKVQEGVGRLTGDAETEVNSHPQPAFPV